MKRRSLAVCVVSLTVLCAALPAAATAAPESACGTVTIHATNSSGAVAPGNTIGLAGQFYNCSSRKARYRYSVWAMSSCGQKVDLASGRTDAIDGGYARIWSISYTIPSDMCSGAMQASIQLDDQDGNRTSASTTVTIQ